MAKCHYCDGTGKFKDARCAGRGQVRCETCNGSGKDTVLGIERTCPRCGGSGEMSCPDCGGSGKMTCPNCHGSGEE